MTRRVAGSPSASQASGVPLLATLVHDQAAAGVEGRVLERRAVKGIALRDRAVLLLRAATGALKLPGGGAEAGESDEECLRRELAEECGMPLLSLGAVLGDVVQVATARETEYDTFTVTSRHLFCEVGEATATQRLDGYEQRLGLVPVWVDLREAVRTCARLVEGGHAPRWLERDHLVLRIVRDRLGTES